MVWDLTIYNCLFFSASALFLFIIFQTEPERRVWRSILLGISLCCMIFLAAVLYPVDGFGRIQLLAWGAFLQIPLFLIGLFIINWNNARTISGSSITLVLLISLIGMDAFLIEPSWLEVTHYRLYSPKLNQPLTIAILADIQTDQPGSYEAEVLSLTKDQDPDLVLLAGDYLQIGDPDKYQAESIKFREILEEANLHPPLGIYAVKGNVDHNDWLSLFGDMDVVGFKSTETLDLGPLALTGISWADSVNTRLFISGTDSYHIVLGHSPNFSLGEIDGDLLIAGHTHGGQFQLPGIGPILTLSAVPRDWASGLTEIHPDQYLLVSRGIGLERGNSPRMRFLCRPELMILHLSPSNKIQSGKAD